MSGDVEIRGYRPGDEEAILRLFRESFGSEMSPAFWRWRFAENPTGRVLVELAWAGDELAAHYAVSPVVVRVDGQDVMTALSMTTMTHPAFRGRGLFQRLAESVYARMAADGDAMVWGFPNANSHRGFVRDLGWRDVAEVPTLVLPLEGRALPAPGASAAEAGAFDERFDALWAEVADRWRVAVRRDRRFLAWRYGAHPSGAYTTLAREEGGRLLGYAVFKAYGGGADLVDLLAVDEETARDLVLSVAERARAAGLRSVSTWTNLALPLHHELERLGFRNDAPVTYFGARPLGPGGDAATSYAHWYLTMGDSDVY